MLYVHDTIIALAFFSFWSLSRILVDARWFWELALMFVTRISKNALCPFRQTLLALVSDLALSPMKLLMFSPFMGWKWGSTSTSMCTCFIRFASKSLLCLVTTNPPWKLWVKTCLSLTIILFLRLNKATSLYIVYTEKNLELIMSFFNFNILPPLTYQPYLNHNLLLYSPSTAAFLVDLISNLCSLSASTSSSLTSSFSLYADSFYL